MANQSINVCLIGHRFMGKAHSNAYLKAAKFFTLPVEPVMHTVVGRDAAGTAAFAKNWGWKHVATDWKQAISNPEVQLVDVATPNNAHHDMAIAALEAGKHVACEKPLAITIQQAREMRDAAKKAKGKTFVWYNYRRVPAIALAHQFVKEGKLGRIYQIRASYLQDWAKASVPLTWRFQRAFTGSGVLGDLGAHIIDMARFITGQEVDEVVGAINETFIKERDIPEEGSGGGIGSSASSAHSKKGVSDVDDAFLLLARMTGGAVASFEATRFATGYQNRNGIEIHGEKGAIRFNFEDMNYLDFYDVTIERKQQGWTQIIVMNGANHPYVGAWWPDAHMIGYEHGFINQTADMMRILGGEKPVVALPDFDDAYKTQQVMEAAERCAAQRRPVKVAEVG
jgi:predicted dehydrogenase